MMSHDGICGNHQPMQKFQLKLWHVDSELSRMKGEKDKELDLESYHGLLGKRLLFFGQFLIFQMGNEWPWHLLITSTEMVILKWTSGESTIHWTYKKLTTLYPLHTHNFLNVIIWSLSSLWHTTCRSPVIWYTYLKLQTSQPSFETPQFQAKWKITKPPLIIWLSTGFQSILWIRQMYQLILRGTQ